MDANSLYSAFSSYCASLSEAIVRWTNPSLAPSARPHGSWPLMRLEHALIAVVLYCCLLLVGMVKRSATAPAPARGAKSSPAVAPAPALTLAALLRDPIKLVQVAYNASQVAISLTMAVTCAWFAYRQRYGFFCNAFDAGERNVSLIAYFFYASKLYDFMDTVFIISRGKWNQFTFLHTYHHVRCGPPCSFSYFSSISSLLLLFF